MTVYAVFEVDVHEDDSEAYTSYRTAVPGLIERFGGRYLARAAPGRALEGAPTTGRWHLVEFPGAAEADAFWTCPEYNELKAMRSGAATVRAVLIDPDGRT